MKKELPIGAEDFINVKLFLKFEYKKRARLRALFIVPNLNDVVYFWMVLEFWLYALATHFHSPFIFKSKR